MPNNEVKYLQRDAPDHSCSHFHSLCYKQSESSCALAEDSLTEILQIS